MLEMRQLSSEERREYKIGDTTLEVLKRGEDDGNGCGDIDIKLIRGEAVLSSALLKSLWLNEDAECNTAPQYAKFREGDFYQQTFNAYPPGEGLGPLLHDALVEAKEQIVADGFVINNIYSSHEEDGYIISADSIRFWQKREAKNKAVWDKDSGRYRAIY